MKKKILLGAIIALSLALLVAVGGSIAWLIAETNEIENVFTPSNINVTLVESNITTDNKWYRQMIPGNVISKDPTVEITDTNINAWLFVKVTKSSNLDSFIAYAIADGWTLYDGDTDETNNVTTKIESTNELTYYIYRKVNITDTTKSFSILGKGSYTYGNYTVNWEKDHVGVKPEVTKEMMNNIGSAYPTLTFDAAAVQVDNLSLTDAFAQVVWTTPTTPGN